MGSFIFDKHELDDSQSLYLDACLLGMGAVWKDSVFYANS